MLKERSSDASPLRRVGCQIGTNPNSTKLHHRVAWFYRRLCEEYECPILPQFLQETIPQAFKKHGLNSLKDSVNDDDVIKINKYQSP